MNYREVTLLAKKSLGDSGTETFDLETLDPMTELVVYFEQDNDTSAVSDLPPERQISKIEIVDGGSTLWSLSGQEAVGVAAVEMGRWPLGFYNETENQNTWIHIPIRFGRFLGDTEFGFLPTAYRNPQLKVTYSLGTGHETLLNELAIYAKVMQGVPAPSNCLMWRSLRSYTSTASTDEITELPIDYPYRRLMVRGFDEDGTFSTTISNYKLACDIDALTIFDLGWKAMYDVVLREFGPLTNDLKACVGSIQYVQTWLDPTWSATITCRQAARMAKCNPRWTGDVGAETYDATGAVADASDVIIRPIGINPHHCLQYQFGDRGKPDTWFNAPGYKTVKLTLTHGANTGAISVAVQQPR